jgi:O-antigen ligase
MGPLSNLAASFCIYSFLESRKSGRLNIKGLVLFFAPIFLLIGTATRTSVGVVMLELSLLFIYTLYAKRGMRKVLIVGCLIGVVALGVVLESRTINDLVEGVLPLRVALLWNENIATGTIYGQDDEDRMYMNEEAITQIDSSPIFGRGLGATRFGSTVVHNAFLQTWADLGIIGAIGFFGLHLQVWFYLPRALRRCASLESYDQTIYIQCVVFSASAWFIWCFNAFSTELSDNMIIVVQLALFYHLLCRSTGLSTRSADPDLFSGFRWSIHWGRSQSVRAGSANMNRV